MKGSSTWHECLRHMNSLETKQQIQMWREKKNYKHIVYWKLEKHGDGGTSLQGGCDMARLDVRRFCVHLCVCERARFTYVRRQDVRCRCHQAFILSVTLWINSSCSLGKAGLIHVRLTEHGRWMYFFICVNSHSQLLTYLCADGKL